MTEHHRIVVIEDDPQLRRFLKTGLEAHNYEVIPADTGQAGLAAIVAQKPDAVLLDLVLPDMDGAQLLDEMRAWSQAPV
ncbi:MAG: response regulator transcription factor, partial [Rhodospirillales bacterium]